MRKVEKWNSGGLKTLAATRREKFLGMRAKPSSDQFDEGEARV